MLASGVQMEAYSIEDEGNGVCFNVYCFNAQPGITIDYKSGDSYLLENSDHLYQYQDDKEFILNAKTMRYHTSDCNEANKIDSKYKRNYSGDISKLKELGYSPCSKCN